MAHERLEKRGYDNVKCPKCGSEHVQFATNTSGSGVSFLDSCCGFILLGPLGLLCGTIGSGAHTEEFWICHDCGHRFSTRQGKQRIQNEQQRKETYIKYKSEIGKLRTTEGDYKSIQAHHQEALVQYNTTKQRYEQVLSELVSSDDRKIKKKAKSLRRNWITNILAGILVLGILSLLYIAPLGIFLIIVSIISALLYETHRENNRKKLAQYSASFKTAAENVTTAKKQEEYYKALVDKISFIEKYETSQHES